MELSSRQIGDKHFTTAVRGYNRREVDDFIAECAGHTGSLEERTKIAEVRAAASENELAMLRADIDVLLEEATEARRMIIDEAREEADTIARQAEAAGGSTGLSDVASKAAAIITEAETTATLRLEGVDSIQRAAEEKAEGIVKRAEETAAMTEAEADRLLDKARLDANSMREETNMLRTSMETQLAEIRRILEVARSRDGSIDELLAAEDSELVVDLRKGADKPADRHATT